MRAASAYCSAVFPVCLRPFLHQWLFLRCQENRRPCGNPAYRTALPGGKRLPYRFHVHKGGKGAYHRGCRSRSRHWRAFLHASCPSRSIPSFCKKAYPGGRPPSGTLHRKTTGSGPARLVQAYGRLSRQILGFAAPLSANRLCLNVLQAIEAACIPAKLQVYGHSVSDSLSVYGVLTGMALPLIFSRAH